MRKFKKLVLTLIVVVVLYSTVALFFMMYQHGLKITIIDGKVNLFGIDIQVSCLRLFTPNSPILG